KPPGTKASRISSFSTGFQEPKLSRRRCVAVLRATIVRKSLMKERVRSRPATKAGPPRPAQGSASRIEPMEARSVDAIPIGERWQYEPKWDGFRCLLERDLNIVTMTSKSGQDLGRYFPEILRSAAELPEHRFVLDGELVVPVGDQFSFDALLQR